MACEEPTCHEKGELAGGEESWEMGFSRTLLYSSPYWLKHLFIFHCEKFQPLRALHISNISFATKCEVWMPTPGWRWLVLQTCHHAKCMPAIRQWSYTAGWLVWESEGSPRLTCHERRESQDWVLGLHPKDHSCLVTNWNPYSEEEAAWEEHSILKISIHIKHLFQ